MTDPIVNLQTELEITKTALLGIQGQFESLTRRIQEIADSLRWLQDFVGEHIHPADVDESISWCHDGRVSVCWVDDIHEIVVETSGNHPDVISARQAAMNEYGWEMSRWKAKHER